MSYRYPPGWFPPYHGAAPPMPPDLSFNRQQWQKGSWQFNPTYNWQRYSVPQMQWSWTHPSHRPPQSFPANFNPYKKAIKPPSAEYLAMKVSDNGLDLHNMVPAAQLPPQPQPQPVPEVPKTPWIWNPANLADDAPAEEALTTPENRAQIRSSSESRLPDSAPAQATKSRHATDPSSSASASTSQVNPSTGTMHSNTTSPLKTTFSSKIIRTPAHYAPPSSAPASVDSLASHVERLSTSAPPPLSRQSSMPSIYSDSKQSSSISGVQLSDEPMSILSPLIIPMTPHPAKRPITRGATYPNISNHSGLDTIREAPAVEVTTPHGSSRPHETPTEIHVPQTAPASQQSFTRPPPVRSESYPRSVSSSVSRDAPHDQSTVRNINNLQDPHRPSIVQQHTPPDIDSYPALRQAPPRPQTPRRPIEIYSSTPPPPQRSHSSSHIPTRRSSSHQLSPTHTTSKHSPSEPSHSPKHTPPSTSQDYPITPVSLRRQTTAPASSYVYEEERPKPIKPAIIYVPVSLPPRQRLRIGFWNSRGDHCTKEGYIVFAPPDQAFPTELSTYPERDYQDDLGIRIAFDPKRPELPESLPRHGQPPEKPYKDFLVYRE